MPSSSRCVTLMILTTRRSHPMRNWCHSTGKIAWSFLAASGLGRVVQMPTGIVVGISALLAAQLFVTAANQCRTARCASAVPTSCHRVAFLSCCLVRRALMRCSVSLRSRSFRHPDPERQRRGIAGQDRRYLSDPEPSLMLVLEAWSRITEPFIASGSNRPHP